MLPSIIRTVVPLIVGWLLSIPVVAGLGIDQSALETLFSTLISIVYYVVVRQIEKYYPKAGILLGYPAAPSYTPPSGGDGA